MPYKDYSWTYLGCAIENNAKNKIQKELKNVWINLSLNLNITTCRFFYNAYDNYIRERCPTLCLFLKDKEIDKITTGIGFMAVPPGSYTPLHIDLGACPVVLGLPVVNCEKSYTVWYKDPPPLKLPKVLDCLQSDSMLGNPEDGEWHYLNTSVTTSSVPYFEIIPELEMARVESTNFSWQNSGIPHRAEVNCNKLRVFATLRFDRYPPSLT